MVRLFLLLFCVLLVLSLFFPIYHGLMIVLIVMTRTLSRLMTCVWMASAPEPASAKQRSAGPRRYVTQHPHATQARATARRTHCLTTPLVMMATAAQVKTLARPVHALGSVIHAWAWRAAQSRVSRRLGATAARAPVSLSQTTPRRAQTTIHSQLTHAWMERASANRSVRAWCLASAMRHARSQSAMQTRDAARRAPPRTTPSVMTAIQ